MNLLNVRNVQEALPRGLQLLDQIGIRRESRNGPVSYGGAVTVIYERPLERVIFWPERDANPFFHLYESLWMLAGRNDVAPLLRYVKRVADYSDDGFTFHGAYGHRWRRFDTYSLDQLAVIADILRKNPDDRRCVLQMWDAKRDLLHRGRDLPCNTVATLQRDPSGKLDLTVFNRSNDIVWGMFGANAVQFGSLLEYMAIRIGCPPGTYTQITVNYHGYLDTLEQVKNIRPDRMNFINDPYASGKVRTVPMEGTAKDLDNQIGHILFCADSEFIDVSPSASFEWAKTYFLVLKAHQVYRKIKDDSRYLRALEVLAEADQSIDWVVAATEWIQRRENKHES